VEPILDETSLVPSTISRPAARIEALAQTLTALDELGVARVLRSVRDAADRDLGDGNGLRRWCFAGATQREKDAGRLVASRLDKKPYVDGDGGLFAAAEGTRAVETTVAGGCVMGIGLAALTDGLVVALTTDARATGTTLTVDVTYVDEDGQRAETVDVRTFTSPVEVNTARADLVDRVCRTVSNGVAIVQRLGELFPRIHLGDDARKSIEAMTGNEPVFRQLVRHLRALDEGARLWTGGAYAPVAVSYSVESEATLKHGVYGPQRDFATPPEFRAERWSLHTKMTGGNGARMYFRSDQFEERLVVLVGYVGPHLATVKHH
jgi:hypothetical protein